ncbi:uncharacterized protein BYT42DRAFT_497602, partial [Radiomyces spectabilis]|uniref:uncharacterized protein n=1 Tax=Radiomyces spectabilis TaxID=64574 RepID=UPI00222047DC
YLALGNHVTFYMMDHVSKFTYIMFEVAHVQISMSIKELPFYLTQVQKLQDVICSWKASCTTAQYRFDPGDFPRTNDNELSTVVAPRSSNSCAVATGHYFG